MIDESCEVPREDLDEGFNPCRRQVVENGELCQYAHMYDVMNERYDREEDTSYLNSVKRDRISQSTPSQSTDGGKIYSQDTDGVEGFISTSGTLEPTTNAEIPSSKAVANYVAGAVADYAPIPLPISKGGTGGSTPYVADDLDSSAVFVMHDAPNDRYDAAPMSALTGYLDSRYNPLIPSYRLTDRSDLNNIQDGTYYTKTLTESNNLLHKPNYEFTSSVRVDQFANGYAVDTRAQIISENLTGTTFYRCKYNDEWGIWKLLYPTDAQSPATPPSYFSFQVSPFPAGDWEGEMTVDVEPVLSTTVGSTTYILARVYGSKKFNYTGTDTGTAFNIPLFSILKPTEYPYIFSGGTNIATTLNIHGRSYTPGTYGFVPSCSASEVLIKDQVVSSVFSSGNLNITHHLNCVFGDGTNTPGVTVSFNCLALMWRSEM